MAFFRHLRLTFFVILIFQLSVGNVIAASGDGTSSNNSELAKVAKSTYSNPRDRANALEFNDAAEQLEKGTFPNQNPEINPFRIKRQRVELYKNNHLVSEYSLDESRVDKPTIAFTNLKPRYNTKTRELVFEATTGDRTDGTGGTVVARHIIPDMDIVGITYDRDIVSMIDSEGRLHAIDMGLAVTIAFNNPILVFDNLWTPPEKMDLTGKNVRLDNINRGVRPIADNADWEGAVIPLDKNGQVDLERKLLVRYMDGNKEKVLGLFSTAVTEQIMKEGTALAIKFGSLAKVDKDAAKFFLKNETELEKIIESKADQIISSQEYISPFRNLDTDQLKALQSRLPFYNNLDRRFDKFTMEEWKKDHAEMVQTTNDPKKLEQLAQKAKLLQEKATSEEHRKIYRDVYAEFLADADARQHLAQEGSLAKAWQVVIDPKPIINPFETKKASAKKQNITSERVAEWKLVGLVTGTLAAYLSGAALMGHSETVQQIQALSWIYDHMYFDVLKDANYRLPLSMSVMSWIGVWPLVLAASFTFEKALNAANAVYKNRDTALAQYVRELHKTWGPLTDWQRVVSVGMRAYSFVVYPYLRVLIESRVGLSQKAFLSAYENGMNPFKKIKKDSELGQQLNLEKDQYVGLNNPLLDKKTLAQVKEQKIKIQSAIQRQSIRTKSLSWMLATMVVAEKNGIDPGTLLQASQERVTPEQLRAIFNDPAKQREWELLSDEIQNDLKSRDALTLNQEVKDLSPEKIAEFYSAAKEAAAKIGAMSEFKQKTALRWKKFKSVPTDFINFMTLQNGKNDATFLRGLVANKFVTSQVKQEFRNDHFMVVLLTAFFGGRADLSKPENLTADANGFMFTNHQHNYDMAVNTFAHFFVSGASLALVFQKLRSQQETNYLPKEDFTLTGNVRQEGFFTGLKNWFSFGYNERTDKPDGAMKKGVHFMYNLATESDMGGVMAKRIKKRFTTIQAGITMAIFLRTVVGGQDIQTAMSAWALMFLAGQWYYGWVWDPVQRGNQMTEERFERNNNEFNDIKFGISQALKNGNMEALDESYNKLAKLFEATNPEALGQLKTLLNANIDKVTNPGQSSFTSIEKEYYGLIARLAEAKATNNQAQFDQSIELLRKVIVEKQGYDKDEVAKLNAESLLEFSRSNPPIYTHPHRFLSGFFTWNGAVWSTYLAIPLCIKLFSPQALSPESLLEWVFISAGLYTGAWALLGRTPWLYYEKMYNKVSERFSKKSEIKDESTKSETSKAPLILAPGAACSRLFS